MPCGDSESAVNNVTPKTPKSASMPVCTLPLSLPLSIPFLCSTSEIVNLKSEKESNEKKNENKDKDSDKDKDKGNYNNEHKDVCEERKGEEVGNRERESNSINKDMKEDFEVSSLAVEMEEKGKEKEKKQEKEVMGKDKVLPTPTASSPSLGLSVLDTMYSMMRSNFS